MKKEMFIFDFEKFFTTLYAAHYIHSNEAKLFKKGAAHKRTEEYRQDLNEIQADFDEQENFGRQFFDFLGKNPEYSDLYLFLMRDFLESYDLFEYLRWSIDNLRLFSKKVAA